MAGITVTVHQIHSQSPPAGSGQTHFGEPVAEVFWATSRVDVSATDPHALSHRLPLNFLAAAPFSVPTEDGDNDV
jgi:hypothetical protein